MKTDEVAKKEFKVSVESLLMAYCSLKRVEVADHQPGSFCLCSHPLLPVRLEKCFLLVHLEILHLFLPFKDDRC